MKTRKEKNIWLYVLVLLIILLVGMMVGISLGIGLGIQRGQMMLFEGMGVALADSNINVTIDLNETRIIEGVREIAEDVLVPVLNQTRGEE